MNSWMSINYDVINGIILICRKLKNEKENQRNGRKIRLGYPFYLHWSKLHIEGQLIVSLTFQNLYLINDI